MPTEPTERRRSGRRVTTLTRLPSQPDGALAPSQLPQPPCLQPHSPPPPQTELYVCAPQPESAVRHAHTYTSKAHTPCRMRAILAPAQVLVSAAAAARSAERDAAPSTALMMVSVCATPCAVSIIYRPPHCLMRYAPVAARVRPLQADDAAGSSVAASWTALVAVGSAAAAPEVSARLWGRPCHTRPRTDTQLSILSAPVCA